MDMPIQITDINTIITERLNYWGWRCWNWGKYGFIPHVL